ncbi:MAG TPA: T9SS type A sorting domain-containing protein [Bacteroides sp.]|nr:T9SS type A sorting domain-containing protein [Bacteroides sp.]
MQGWYRDPDTVSNNSLSYKIYNLNSKLLINKNIEDNNIDVKTLESGCYFIEIKMNDNTVGMLRFVK